MIVELLALIALLGISAYFSACETAMTGASRARIYALSAQGNRRALRVEKMHEHMERVISTILFSNTFVNSVAASITTLVFTSFFGSSGTMAVVASICITAAIFIFSEVLPKTYAINNAERTALWVAPVLQMVVMVTYPLTHLTQIIINSVLRLMGVKVEREPGA